MTTHFVNLLDELQRRSLRMAGAVEHMFLEACEAVATVDHNLARRIIERDTEIDQEEVAVEAEALRLMTLFQPMGVDMRQLCTTIKVNGDLERIADCTVNIAERVRHMDAAVTEDARADLKRIYPVVHRLLRDALRAYASADHEASTRLLAEDAVIDAFYGEFIQKLVNEAARSPEIMSAHLDVLSIAKNLERIADHATNIAEDVIYLATGQIVRHRKP